MTLPKLLCLSAAILLTGCASEYPGTFSQRYHCWDKAYSATAPAPALLIFGDPSDTAAIYRACMASYGAVAP